MRWHLKKRAPILKWSIGLLRVSVLVALWSELGPAQRQVWMPLNADWDMLALIRKQKWLKIADRYSATKPDAQQRVQKHMHDWVNLTPKQRRIARENYARAKTKPGQKWAQWKG